ncbi:MAG: bifunctional hydroxymethylpyrimidine kinase/phosphomethylpyrimidine kinase [Agathobacter sp.]|nr:bifunctional hydroxymethylpyrimidine kinase/phosphomethylpyrimidine kinase [Agathobacter sp.]
MKKVAVFNDLSGFGKCSLTAAIPVLSALGVQCCPMASAVLTGQTGYPFYHSTDLTDMILLYKEAWMKNDAHFEGIYSGFMTGPQQIEKFFEFLDVFYEDNTFLLVDPVMGDDGSTYPIYSDKLLEYMKDLSYRADLITPNLTEACLLADYDLAKAYKYKDSESLLGIATEIGQCLREKANGEQEVVITGIKCSGKSSPFIYNLAVTPDGCFTSKSHYFDKSFSGTGDLFASVMCGAKLRGLGTEEAMKLASSFLYHSIADTLCDDVCTADGVNFEKFLIELIQGVK